MSSITTQPATCRWLFINQVLLAILLLQYSNGALAQVSNNDWEQLNLRYEEGTLNDTAYLNAVEVLGDRSFEDAGLKERLERYKKIAWSKNGYHPFRVRYYSLLISNAAFTHQEGRAIYYTQKKEEELRKIPPYVNSLNEPRSLLAIYGRNDQANYEKRQKIFLDILPFLENLPQLISKQKVPGATCVNAMTILNAVGRLYATRQDTNMVSRVAGLSAHIWNSIRQKKDLDRGSSMQCLYLYKQVQLTKAMLGNDVIMARSLLDTSYIVLNNEPAIRRVWAKSVERALLRKYIDFFIDHEQPDSSRHYMKLLAQRSDQNDPGDGTAHLLYGARVEALENNFQQAYQYLLRAYTVNDSVINLKLADINNNLYAQLMAEQKAEEVQALKEQRQKRNIIIVLVGALVIVSIILLFSKMLQNKKAAEKKVEELNTFAQMEIAELEAKANLVRRRLGMELHDDVASELAYVCHLIDKKVIEEKEPERSSQLHIIAEQVRTVYNNTRDKSHQWYMQGITDEHLTFVQSVHRLVHFALPDTAFTKVIEIDDAVLQYISSPAKVHLLRITQAAITNIIRHANAKHISIFIYEDEDAVVLQIKDDGTGFDTNQLVHKNSIGIRSIQERVAEINGTFEILSGKNGTELVVTLPLKKQGISQIL